MDRLGTIWTQAFINKSKSDAVTEILKATEVEPSDQLPNRSDCVVFDAMRGLNEMSAKRFKTDKDLSNGFLHRINAISLNAGLQIVEFDTYSETSSLKDKNRISRKNSSTPPRDFNVNLEINLEKVGMPELLASSKTKRSITDLLIQQTIDHMRKITKDYVIAGNHCTYLYLSLNGHSKEKQNDHEEADTLMIRCLKLVDDVIHSFIHSLLIYSQYKSNHK